MIRPARPFLFPVLALAACSGGPRQIPVCPLPSQLAAEAAPAGSQALAWAPIGTVHFPGQWRAEIGPHSESYLRIRSPDGSTELSLRASCCEGSDLLRSDEAEVASWSGRTVWIEEREDPQGRVQRYFSFPFAHVDAEDLRDNPRGLFRPPISLSVDARCRRPEDCSTIRRIVQSIRYDPEATRLAQKGDETVARVGAASVERGRAEETRPDAAGNRPGSADPPRPSLTPQATFTPELCGT
jgi:hypothetical protein